jgi:hypothetical protein
MRRLGSYEGITVLSFGKRDLERKLFLTLLIQEIPLDLFLLYGLMCRQKAFKKQYI